MNFLTVDFFFTVDCSVRSGLLSLPFQYFSDFPNASLLFHRVFHDESLELIRKGSSGDTDGRDIHGCIVRITVPISLDKAYKPFDMISDP